jgi:hypothetical protein
MINTSNHVARLLCNLLLHVVNKSRRCPGVSCCKIAAALFETGRSETILRPVSACSNLDLIRDNPFQVEVERCGTLKAQPSRSREVETIEVHHFVPGRYKVMDKLLLRVRTSVDFGKRTKLGV